MKIGVFDSGVGGLSMARAIEHALPEHQVLFRNDAKHVPYGSKKPEEVLEYVEPIVRSLVQDGCQIIVIACNTVSTTLIDSLRERTSVPLIAMEPMVKPAAALTKSKVIAVCATPATLKSARYHWLKQTYAQEVKVIEPDCRSWARMIEDKKFNMALVADEINDAITLGADVIVLGCTHYHWIEQQVKAIAGSHPVPATVLQPEVPVIKELQRQIKQLKK